MSHIPTYVYAIFFILLYIGLKQCVTRTIPLSRLLIGPAIFIYLGVYNNALLSHSSTMNLFLLLTGVIPGCFIGYLHVKNRIIRADRHKKLIEVPGDIFMLPLIMAIFFIKFFIDYTMDAHWSVSHNVLFMPLVLLISGFIVGMSLGRNVTYFSKYISTESTHLKES